MDGHERFGTTVSREQWPKISRRPALAGTRPSTTDAASTGEQGVSYDDGQAVIIHLAVGEVARSYTRTVRVSTHATRFFSDAETDIALLVVAKTTRTRQRTDWIVTLQ